MTENIFSQYSPVSREDRQSQNNQHSTILWFTGLPCSGKSTLAYGLHSKLFQQGNRSYVLDGDNIRHGLNSDLTFSPKDRKENIRRIGEVSKLILDAGLFALTAFISPYQEDRNQIRASVPEEDFIEIFVDCPLAVCEKRDVKGLYQKARSGLIPEFTGITAPYQPPLNPEITLNTSNLDLEASLNSILSYLKTHSYLG